MEKLEKIVKENREEFDNETLLDGDLERFRAKLATSNIVIEEYKPERRIKINSSLPRRKSSFWKVTLIPLAATLIILYGVNLVIRSLSKDNDLRNIYVEYINDLNTLSTEIESIAIDKEGASMIVNNITFEAIPLTNQLPNELSNDEKAKIIREYYNQRLDGVRKFKTLLADSMIDIN